MKKWFVVFGVLFVAGIFSISSYFFGIPFKWYEEGTFLDELNGVEVYYNGSTSHIEERNVAPDGYNIGLKWQCVEFVKRYYLEFYQHKMPNSYGNAVDFFNKDLTDGALNVERDLVQYRNPSLTSPELGDIIVFSGSYGHVAIVSSISTDYIEMVQQNVGFNTREELSLTYSKDGFGIGNGRVLGWLSRNIKGSSLGLR